MFDRSLENGKEREVNRVGETLDDLRWRIIHGGEAGRNMDRSFFYAVRTTGIYCRPDCRSKRPRRENTLFFDDPRDAEMAGFRPCLRCRPRGDDEDSRKLIQICELIDASDDVPVLADLAAAAGIGGERLRKMFRLRLGITPQVFAQARRRQRLRDLLPGADSVTGAFYDAGYGGSSRFYEKDGQRLGMKPKCYRRGGVGERISFMTADCPLGRMLVARTAAGICTIEIGDDDQALEAALRKRFDRACLTPEPSDGDWKRIVMTVIDLIEEPQRSHDLPLDIRGTAFQERVWQGLMTIPCGETWSYAQVARAIGAPTAVRAVASACARNPLLLAIPCHRVVREDGSIGGYRAGTDRKRHILENERSKIKKNDTA
ncbi:MAG: bifunctional DNA-binding transcriptional regulator/O6-methylguanine-DNA methyltransferase Ada [Geminicoccaceae bacterium]|nr:bifunctional DNA-binding transcriptional regulator/O6-methylguanine-DNA methyltransferase Ada [Geminicoccaceae bacterium]